MAEMKYFAKRYGQTLAPTTKDTADLIESFSSSDIVEITVKKPRHVRHHRKFWAVLGVVARNTEYEKSDILLDYIKVRLGYVDWFSFKTSDGIALNVPRPKSISFKKMDQVEFSEFYERAMTVIQDDLGFDLALTEKEI